MNAGQTRAGKARRALLSDPSESSQASASQPRRAARAAAETSPSPWRRGLALAAVSGIGITAVGVFGASNYPATGTAFAQQAIVSPSGIAEARAAAESGRSAARPVLSFEELVEQRADLIAETNLAVETERDETAAENRTAAHADTAAAVDAEADRLRNLTKFLWPTEGGVGSPWGQRLHPILRYYRLHGGADIGGRCGQPIYAAQSGTVTKADAGGYNGGSGSNVRIDHGDIKGTRVETAYLHMSNVAVKVGQKVNKGDFIGNVGNTGLSTACHLHLSLYKDGVNSNPLEYLQRPKASQSKDEAREDENTADRELGETTQETPES